MRSPAFYKFLSAALAVLLALGSAYAGKMIHDAQLEVNNFRQQQDDLQKQADAARVKLQKYQEFFQLLQTNPAFLDYIARQHLGYAKPDELIYRFDVDPLTGAPPASSESTSQPPQLSPLPPPTLAPPPGVRSKPATPAPKTN